jgi:hypothetical protein
MLRLYSDHTDEEFLARLVRQLIREGRAGPKGKNLSQVVRESVRKAQSQRGKRQMEGNEPILSVTSVSWGCFCDKVSY